MLNKSEITKGQAVYHKNLNMNGNVTSLETGDITSVYVMFNEDDEREVSIHLLENFKMEIEPIKVWKFQDAPESLQKLSDAGGDEDWLILLPLGMTYENMYWLLSNSFNSEPQRIELPNTQQVIIGSH